MHEFNKMYDSNFILYKPIHYILIFIMIYDNDLTRISCMFYNNDELCFNDVPQERMND